MPFFGLTDEQMRAIMMMAAPLELTKRDIFLQRLAARLKLERMRGGRPSNVQVQAAAQDALAGLLHGSAAA
jgi:hypothetical protein